jgi:hypothetical protein
MKCKVCGKDDSDRPMCFLGLPYCSELHRKQIAASEGKA